MRRLFVAGNWKMNTTLESGRALAAGLAQAIPSELARVDVAICPPFPYLTVVGSAVAGSGVQLGAQTASHQSLGAFTGEVAVEMLKDVGCRWVILGHSERRQFQSESDELISRKARKVLDTGLRVILCVGESLVQRQSGQTESVLDGQMAGSLAGIAETDLDRMVIAYEPVWAIGTGVTATTEQAQSAHRHLRTWLGKRYNPSAADGLRILYGGSVKASNAAALLAQPDVDGALVGGASLKIDDFLPIVRAADSVAKS
jgi:triosephosphate isomerase